ncbi:MAG: hypothetical protein ACUVYA_21615, partial [Planctomycetota bacterium]
PIVGGGLRHEECSFYRFFFGFRFRREVFFRILFEENRQGLPARQERLPVDDTLCPNRGRHIFGVASFFDHSPRLRPAFIWGHNWVVLPIVVELFGVTIALQKICKEGEFRTPLEIVAEALSCVRRWTCVPILLLADGAYNNKSLLTPLSASIYRETLTLKVKSFDAWWPKSGVKIRVAITRDPKVRGRICYMSSTDLRMSPAEIIQAFPMRWSIDEVFADAKLEIGLVPPRFGQRTACVVTRPAKTCKRPVPQWSSRKSTSRGAIGIRDLSIRARSRRVRTDHRRAPYARGASAASPTARPSIATGWRRDRPSDRRERPAVYVGCSPHLGSSWLGAPWP